MQSRLDVELCPCCRKLFKPMSQLKLCHNCYELVEEQYQKVSTYMTVHPLANMEELSEALQVSMEQIVIWMREERLSFDETVSVTIPCQCCGTEIKRGRYCLACSNQLKGLYHSIRSTQVKPFEPSMEVEEVEKKVYRPNGLRFTNHGKQRKYV